MDEIIEQWSLERPDLDTSSLAAVVRILTLYRTLLKQATEALKPVGLELWEYDVLSALRRQGGACVLTASGLAETTSLSAGAMTNRIDKLESRRLVRRQVKPDDRRTVMVSLTPRGRRTIDAAIQLRLDAARKGLDGLDEGERSLLAALLRKVVIASRREQPA